ncbi:MAG TPA: STAS domain-containing protein [Candidatus Kapabacteria bacterium]|nr:STAS domain-containing protein [Candidatus Kapabacteria bacterium]
MLVNVDYKESVAICRYHETKMSNLEHSHLRDTVEKLYDTNVKLIAMDLSKVTYIGSPGIGALISINDYCIKLQEKFEDEVYKFVIFGLNSTNTTLFKMLRIDTFIKITNNEEEAIEYLNS